jgi:hypothetical protein
MNPVTMYPVLAIGLVIILFSYIVLYALLQFTQNRREPRLLEMAIPFFDSALGIMKHRAEYLNKLRYGSSESHVLTLAHTKIQESVSCQYSHPAHAIPASLCCSYAGSDQNSSK